MKKAVRLAKIGFTALAIALTLFQLDVSAGFLAVAPFFESLADSAQQIVRLARGVLSIIAWITERT